MEKIELKKETVETLNDLKDVLIESGAEIENLNDVVEFLSAYFIEELEAEAEQEKQETESDNEDVDKLVDDVKEKIEEWKSLD